MPYNPTYYPQKFVQVIDIVRSASVWGGVKPIRKT